MDGANFGSFLAWKSINVKSWIWKQQAMHPELNDNSYFRKKWGVESPAQVLNLLNGADPDFIEKYIGRKNLLYLNCFPVTPNCHPVTEVPYAISSGSFFYISLDLKAGSLAALLCALCWIGSSFVAGG
ncbi:hypothetical protein JHK87_007048 [Glycine soja]|nr:hypothetical protein JHK87_007048 [Glycine soja]